VYVFASFDVLKANSHFALEAIGTSKNERLLNFKLDQDSLAF